MKTQIQVEGLAYKNIEADTIILTLTITSEGKDANIVFQKNKDAKKNLLQNLKAVGFTDKDLKTTNFSMQPLYKSMEKNGIYTSVFDGYQMNEGLRLTFPIHFSILNETLMAIHDLDSIIHFSIQFASKMEEDIQAELFNTAYQNAWQKAQWIAKGSNLKIVGVEKITELKEDLLPRERIVALANDLSITPEDTLYTKKLAITFVAER